MKIRHTAAIYFAVGEPNMEYKNAVKCWRPRFSAFECAEASRDVEGGKSYS